MTEQNVENNEKDSKVDNLLYLKGQKRIIEIVGQFKEKNEQIMQFQRNVILLYHEKWSKMDSSVESIQEDIDDYTKEYIIPMQEKQQELHKLEETLICIPNNYNIIGRVGKFFERFIPGITKEGRIRRDIEERKETIKEEIETYRTIMEKHPFKIFGTNKDIKGQVLQRMDVTNLDKYSTMKNDPKNYLQPNNTVKSVVAKMKREEMTELLNSYPVLKAQMNYLIDELINNGFEAFNSKVTQILKDNSQKKSELISKLDSGQQGDRHKER